MTTVVDADPAPEAPGQQPARPRRRWLVVAAALAGFLVAAGITGGVLLLGDDGDAEQREAMLEYAAGIDQVARTAGSVIELEMKPAIADIEAGEGRAGFAERWADDLADLRAGLAEQEPPPGAEDAHDGFLAALDSYAETAGHLAEAADADDTAARDRALDEAVARGERSDQRWNAAREQLEATLREHGIEMQVG